MVKLRPEVLFLLSTQMTSMLIFQVWMRDVRKKSPNVKIVPRVIFDHWTSPHFLQVFEDQNLADKVGYLIAKTIIDNKFDGLVLELWSQLGGQAKLQTTQLVTIKQAVFKFLILTLIHNFLGNQSY